MSKCLKGQMKLNKKNIFVQKLKKIMHILKNKKKCRNFELNAINQIFR